MKFRTVTVNAPTRTFTFQLPSPDKGKVIKVAFLNDEGTGIEWRYWPLIRPKPSLWRRVLRFLHAR